MTTVLDTNTKLENTKDTMDINQIYYTGDHRSSYTKEDIKRLASRERQKKRVLLLLAKKKGRLRGKTPLYYRECSLK